MPNMAYKFAHRRLQVVEEVIEEWEIEHEEAQLACDTEELVRETTDLFEPVARVAQLMRHGIQFHTTTQEIVLAHNVGALLNKTLLLFPRVGWIVDAVRRAGHIVAGFERLRESEETLTQIKNDFCKKWLLPDLERVSKVKQELADGKYLVL